jgi:hypothetical protein
MGRGVNTAALSGSAIRGLASLRRWFQSQQCFGSFAVGARGSWSPAGLRDFVRLASESLRPSSGFQSGHNCLCALGLLARPGLAGARRPMGLSGLWPSGASCSFLRPVCAGLPAHPGFHGFGCQSRAGFHGEPSNLGLGRTPERHCGVNQTFPAGAGQLRC